MKPLGISQATLAGEMGVSAATISRLVNKKADLTASVALRLEERFGTSAEFWMNLQKHYELDTARRLAASEGWADRSVDVTRQQANDILERLRGPMA